MVCIDERKRLSETSSSALVLVFQGITLIIKCEKNLKSERAALTNKIDDVSIFMR